MSTLLANLELLAEALTPDRAVNAGSPRRTATSSDDSTPRATSPSVSSAAALCGTDPLRPSGSTAPCVDPGSLPTGEAHGGCIGPAAHTIDEPPASPPCGRVAVDRGLHGEQR